MILIIGNGGREEAIVYSLSQKAQKPDQIFTAPGNGGGDSRGKNFKIPLSLPYRDLISVIREKNISLVVVGPENYLSDGLSDFLQGEGIPVFGPSRKASQLEGSKSFAKEVMVSAGVATAAYKEFDDHKKASLFINEEFRDNKRWVLKADGLCAGKGVIIPITKEAALSSLDAYFKDRIFGKAGERVIIEEFMNGSEVSVLAFTDGKTVRCLPAAQDHKRIFDGDCGPNTGGMGAYTPVPVFRPGFMKRVEDEIFYPIINEMSSQGIPYRGILYAGLMIDGEKIRVVEFNVRFGDPECQCVLPLLESDLEKVMRACIDEKLDEVDFQVKERSAVCVVLASGGYPGKYEIAKEITGLEDIVEKKNGVNIKTFHAGTSYYDGKFYTAGGRVLSICGYGVSSKTTLEQVVTEVYQQVEKISFEGCYYRKDIGKKKLSYLN